MHYDISARHYVIPEKIAVGDTITIGSKPQQYTFTGKADTVSGARTLRWMSHCATCGVKFDCETARYVSGMNRNCMLHRRIRRLKGETVGSQEKPSMIATRSHRAAEAARLREQSEKADKQENLHVFDLEVFPSPENLRDWNKALIAHYEIDGAANMRVVQDHWWRVKKACAAKSSIDDVV